jgi:hypothetical protein
VKGARFRVRCECGAPEVLALDVSEARAPAARVSCPACGRVRELHAENIDASGGLRGCIGCGQLELYTRKDFPRWLGISIVVLAAALVPVVPYYGSLGAAAALDFALYHLAPDVVVCYRCAGEHRGFAPAPRHPRFDRTIEERLRYGERAVMGSPERAGGTADAPDPEH